MVAAGVRREPQSWRRVRDTLAHRGAYMEKEPPWNQLGK